MPVVQPTKLRSAGPEFDLRFEKEVPARAEPEATSPETDTPTRLFAEICYLLYQERAAGSSSIWGFSTAFFWIGSGDLRTLDCGYVVHKPGPK
jgi:hypothetical protein